MDTKHDMPICCNIYFDSLLSHKVLEGLDVVDKMNFNHRFLFSMWDRDEAMRYII